MFLALTGFALAPGLLAVGVLLIPLGAGILVFAIIRILQLHPRGFPIGCRAEWRSPPRGVGTNADRAPASTSGCPPDGWG